MLKRTLAVATLAISSAFAPALVGAAVAEDLTIERIAPRSSVVVAGVKNFGESRKRLENTPLWTLWKSEQVQSLVADLMKDASGAEQEDEAFWEELGFKPQDVPPPTGAVGFAIFSERNEEIGQDVGAIIAVAEYGENADKAQEIVDKLVERARKEPGTVIDEREIRGRKVFSTEINDADDDDGMDMDDDFGGGMDGADPFEHMDTLHWCRDGSRFLVSTSLVALEDALEVADGQSDLEAIGRNADFQGAIDQIKPTDGSLVLLTSNAKTLFAPLFAGPGAIAEPILGQLLGDVRAWSVGVSIDGAIGMLEQAVGVYAPGEKRGLLALFNTSTPVGSLPGFVGVDAIGYNRINFELLKLMPLVNEIVRGLPPMFRDEIEPQLDGFGPMLDEAFANLGPDIHIVTTQTEPLTSESQSMLVAIRMKKAESVKPLIDMFAPMQGMEPRDFLGQTIYSTDFLPASIGLGGGWLAIGMTPAVEQVMRSVGQANQPGLADEPIFRYAKGSIRSEQVVGWGFSNIVADYAFQRVVMKEQLAQLRQFQADFGDEIDLGVDRAENINEYMDKITPEFLERYLGPTTWELTSRDNGFVLMSYTLAPRKAEE